MNEIWYPNAEQFPKGRINLGNHYTQTQEVLDPRVVIIHSAAGAGVGVRNWLLTNPDGIESHFEIGYDGKVCQFVPLNLTADANYRANPFAVSIESDSNLEASDPFTFQQVRAFTDLIDWICRTLPIPRQQVKTWDGKGLGWHCMFGYNTAENRNINPWTNAIGKTCPGLPYRVEQAKRIISTVIDMAGDNMPSADEIADAIVTKLNISAREGRLDEVFRRLRQTDVWGHEAKDSTVRAEGDQLSNTLNLLTQTTVKTNELLTSVLNALEGADDHA